MMKLSAAARWFDKTVAQDAYSPAATFKCQLEPLDMYRTEGTRIKIRNMSTAPGVSIPERRAVRIDSQVYLVSDSSQDHWAGAALRNRHVLQGADDLVTIRSIGQVLSGAAGTSAYASVDFSKYGTDERDNSDYHPQYHIFFARTEVVPENTVLQSGAKYFLVRNSYVTPAGLVDALSNELDSPVTDSATFKSRAYNPVTDAHVETPTTVRCMRVRWQDSFAYLSQGSTKYERGDSQVFVPLSVSPKSGDRVALGDGVWEVLSVRTLADHHSLHVRRT